MKTVHVVFSRNWLPFSGLIRLLTWSVWSHVQVHVDGHLIGAQPLGGVQRRSVRAGLKGASKVACARLDLTPEQYALLAYILTSKVGARYDWLGIVGLVSRTRVGGRRRWFCSELPAMALTNVGCPLIALDAWRVTPQQLWTSPLYKRRFVGEPAEVEAYLSDFSNQEKD